MSDDRDKLVARKILESTPLAPFDGKLETDELVLARITEGIYRQPASALRELVSNAYDADATEVVILTDAPRFSHITVRDNGRGLSPDVLSQLVLHIGGSAKRSEKGKVLGITAPTDTNKSRGGRQLIGKLGIGLFSVAQFTRHFLIITKTAGDPFRSVIDITLGRREEHQTMLPLDPNESRSFETGSFRIWREHTSDISSQGTEIKLLDLLPRTRDELASEDLWITQTYRETDPDAEKILPPDIHIGRLDRSAGSFSIKPKVPWTENDLPRERFEKLVARLRSLTSERESVDLKKVCDNYVWTLWTLALSAPLKYLEGHPFDFEENGEFGFLKLENRLRGQALELEPIAGKTPRDILGLTSPDGATAGKFEVFFDGIELLRPLLFHDLPKGQSAIKTPLIFIGKQREEFSGRSKDLSGGPLEFEAYLFWAPKIVPKQHQGVVLRIGNASGSLFDPEFMGYETSELTRKSQVTAEIFVVHGLDDAINLDRESFNFAHPHYQFLTKWLHSAFRQFSNFHKSLGKTIRSSQRSTQSTEIQEKVRGKIETALRSRGIEDVPDVEILGPERAGEAAALRQRGSVVLNREIVIPPPAQLRLTDVQINRQRLAERKAIGIAQLLQGMGLLDSLSFLEQEKLIRDIMEIVLMES